MTKADLVYLIQDNILKNNSDIRKREVSHKNINCIIDSFFEVLKEYIARGEHIELRGFGTFETKIRESKKAINPRTKEVVSVPKHAVPIFKPGKELKQLVKEYFDDNKRI
jgi:nucleoid DNA-binding protein